MCGALWKNGWAFGEFFCPVVWGKYRLFLQSPMETILEPNGSSNGVLNRHEADQITSQVTVPLVLMRWIRLLCFTFVLTGLAVGPVGSQVQDSSVVGALEASQEGRADRTPYRYFDTSDGLSNEYVKALAQTPNGLLWIGTATGVVTYDGQSFRSISLPDPLSGRSVTEIQPMPDGSVWIALVGGGVACLGPHGAIRATALSGTTVHRFLMRRDTLYLVTRGAVWHLPPGVERPSRRSLRYDIRAPARVSAFSHSGTGAVDADLAPDGSLWILDGHRGPGRVRPDGSVAFVEVPRAKPGPRWWMMRFTENGRLLLSRDDTLYRLDLDTEALQPLRSNVNGPIYLNGTPGELFVGWDRHVLQYASNRSELDTVLRTQPGLPDLTPSCMLRDREGGIWIGTRTGLFQLPHPSVRHLRSVDGTSIVYPGSFLESDGALWASTWGSGLIQLQPQRQIERPGGYTHWSQKIVGMDGHLHARSGNEWYRWATPQGWHRVRAIPHAVRGDVAPDGTGYFWHDNGLYRHSPRPETDPVQLASWSPTERDAHMVAIAPDTSLIVRHRDVVLRVRRTDGYPLDTLAHVPEIADARGRYMTVDTEGHIWMAMYRAGLVRVDPNGTPQLQRILDGIPMENVRIVGDSLVLASTNEGLYMVDARTGRVRQHLTTADGLHTNLVKAAHLTPDTLYVGHSRSFTLIPRHTLADTSASPPTLLTGLEVNLDERTLTADSVFAASERSVGFSFAGASLTYAQQVRYEVRLSPQDTSWHSTKRPFTRYTNLDPGHHRFEVRARLGTHPPGPSATYAFVVSPHWYETWWFYLLVGGMLLASAIGGVRWRTQYLHRRQRVLETAVEERTQALAEEKEKTEEQAERLLELDQTKNRFFANISHEFRTPLTLLLQPVQQALRKNKGDPVPVRRNHLQTMVDNAQRLRRLIDQLLDLATLEAGRMTLDVRQGDLGAFVQRVADSFTSLAESQDLTFHVEVPDVSTKTTFDPDKLEKIVANLLSNALKFTPAGGRVSIAVQEGDETIEIRVQDTGVGISEAQQDSIFDRFRQADGTSTRAHEGTGLGLAVAHELVALHDGHIEVDSTPEEGSTFIVQLPIRRSPDVASLRPEQRDHDWEAAERPANVVPDSTDLPTEASPSEAASSSPRFSVLVVEDNAPMRRYITECLDERYTTIEAKNGQQAWAMLQDKRPDLVLCDVMMPTMDGFELCRRIKNDATLRTIPVLLLTARADVDDTVEGLDCGADDYLTKPFDTRELVQRIENHLAMREHLRSRYQKEVRIEPTGDVTSEDDLPFLEEVKSTIREHVDNPNFSAEQLADAVALSRRHLSRRLNKIVGKSPSAFIRQYRMKHAAHLLKQDPGTISEVAYAVGFQSPSHFSTVFRKYYDCSPSTYVQRQKNAG